MLTFSVVPSPKVSDTVVEPYNPPSPFTSLSRTPTSACVLITRPSTISASVPSSSPPLPTEISTTSVPPVCLASPVVFVSLVSSTLTFASSESISSHSHVFTGFTPLTSRGSQQYRALTVPELTQQMFDAKN